MQSFPLEPRTSPDLCVSKWIFFTQRVKEWAGNDDTDDHYDENFGDWQTLMIQLQERVSRNCPLPSPRSTPLQLPALPTVLLKVAKNAIFTQLP